MPNLILHKKHQHIQNSFARVHFAVYLTCIKPLALPMTLEILLLYLHTKNQCVQNSLAKIICQLPRSTHNHSSEKTAMILIT